MDRIEQFKELIESRGFPCVGAKSALRKGNMTFFLAKKISDDSCDVELYEALRKFGSNLKDEVNELQSFVVAFSASETLSETAYERALWARLQALHDLDVEKGVQWSRDSVPDPHSPHFSMSVARHSFFVVGMHANASRPARRAPFPVMVFNSHKQFEKLRESGKFSKLQHTIRERDRELAGSINPMVADYGETSEALQYSGRKLPQNWVCPFHA